MRTLEPFIVVCAWSIILSQPEQVDGAAGVSSRGAAWLDPLMPNHAHVNLDGRHAKSTKRWTPSVPFCFFQGLCWFSQQS